MAQVIKFPQREQEVSIKFNPIMVNYLYSSQDMDALLLKHEINKMNNYVLSGEHNDIFECRLKRLIIRLRAENYFEIIDQDNYKDAEVVEFIQMLATK